MRTRENSPHHLSLFVATMIVGCAAVVEGATPDDANIPDAAATARHIDRLLAEADSEPTAISQPPGVCDDATFMRRVSLDVVGDLPSPEEVAALVSDPAPGKRTALIDRLLTDPHYGENWALYWRDVILYRRLENRALIVAQPLVRYLTEQLNNGVGWDEVAGQFITAEGNVREEGSTALILAQEGKPEETTAEVARIFLGIQIQCAQCHDHPTDRWTREQFHELAAFFPRIAVRPINKKTDKRSFQVVGDDNFPRRRRNTNNRRRGTAEHYMSDREKPDAPGALMTPKFFLTSSQLPLGTEDQQRRETLAEWITASPWFAKAQVNRIWTELVGWGFYEPVDDLGPDRHCRSAEVLDYLAAQFAASGFDMKWLIRTIALTQVYQRSYETPSEGDVTDSTTASLAAPDACPSQRLRADQLYNALVTALAIDDSDDNFRQIRGAMKGRFAQFRGPRGQFLKTFGYDPSTPLSEVSGSIPQALVMMNSPQIQRQINGKNPRTMLGRLLKDNDDPREITRQLYLRTLAREPQPGELNACLNYVHDHRDRTEAFEDIQWALLNSAEFLHRK